MLVKELIYSILDLAKAATSDDSFLTEEHVIFLCKKYRAFLIKKEQEKNKGMEDSSSIFEQQEICLDLEEVPAIDGEPCTGGYYLRSTKPIPKLLDGYQPKVYPIDFYQGINISYVSGDRMRYVGSNPYLQNIIYTSIAPNKYLYMNSSNPQFHYLKKIRLTGVFEDIEAANDLLCDEGGGIISCDYLDSEFPIREYLVPTLIELVVKEISGTKYMPVDKVNDAMDNLPQMVNSKS